MTTETQQETLDRIQSGYSKNDTIVMMAFNAAGVPLDDIIPRQNVLTYKAWRAAGRQVAKGAKSLRVTVWIPKKDKKDPKTGETIRGGVYPKTCSLFHISQTVPKDADDNARPDAWQNPALVREGTYSA